MIASFLVESSATPSKIGTQATRELEIVQENDVPEIIFDGQKAISIDRKTTQSTVVATYERIFVQYVFPVEELYLDNEFRRSAAAYGNNVELDMTSYPWINRTLQVSFDIEPITTSLVGCTHLRRSFNALVVG